VRDPRLQKLQGQAIQNHIFWSHKDGLDQSRPRKLRHTHHIIFTTTMITYVIDT